MSGLGPDDADRIAREFAATPRLTRAEQIERAPELLQIIEGLRGMPGWRSVIGERAADGIDAEVRYLKRLVCAGEERHAAALRGRPDACETSTDPEETA